MGRRGITAGRVAALHAASSRVWGLDAAASALRLEPLRLVGLPPWDRTAFGGNRGADHLNPSEAALCLLAMAVEAKDRTLKGHCARLAHYAVALGRAAGLDAAALDALRRGAVLHDIGKVWIPAAILFKPGPLTVAEWAVMRRHPLLGERLCQSVRGLQVLRPIIRHHHERWDGSGYPDGLAGPAIPLPARILQVVDIFDALTSDRPYHHAVPRATALTILEAQANKGWSDPGIVRVLRNLVGETGLI